MLVGLAGAQTYSNPNTQVPIGGPIRSNYGGSAAGDKMLDVRDLDGVYVKSVTRASNTITVTFQDSSNDQDTLAFTLGSGGGGGGDPLESGSYDESAEELTLTLQSGTDVTVGVSDLVTADELTAALGLVSADEISVSTANFAGNLTASDDDVQAALDTLDDLSVGGTDDQTASEVDTDTSNFGTNLSSADTTVQAALETLDDLSVGGGGGGASLSDDDPEAVAELAAAGTGTEASRSDHVHAGIAWGVQIDTQIVPQVSENAISTPRISLRTSGLTRYLAFLDWTAANLARVDHLPVGGHIGLRQGVNTRILRVEDSWESSENRYHVTNVNGAALTEAASGTDTELLLTTSSEADGVVSSADFDEETGELTLTRSVGTALTVNVDEIVRPESSGDLPAASDNENRVALAGNTFFESRDIVITPSHDRDVTLTNLPIGGVVISGTTYGGMYAGNFAVAPNATNYSLNDYIWDRGSQVWLLNALSSLNAKHWLSYSGPAHFRHGTYYDDAFAESHANSVGEIFIVGTGSSQAVKYVSAFTAATNEQTGWVWVNLGVTFTDIETSITGRLSDATPAAVAATAAAGTGTGVSRDDHVHVGSSGGSDLAIQEEGAEVASAATTINFTGTGATATASGGTVTVDIPGGGGGSSSTTELWTGDIAVGTSNTWVAAGTDVVPSTATWLLFNGGTLTSGTDDGAPADWKWVNATAWRGLTASTATSTVSDGTAMQFAEWPSTDVGSTNFTRRDVKIGRTSTNTVLIASMDAGEDFNGAAIRYITGFGGGGFELHSGTDDPSSADGADGDWWLNTTDGAWFEKTSGSWGSAVYTDQVGAAGSGQTESQVNALISTHNTSTTAHNDIRSDLSDAEDRLDALDPVEIEAYDSTATYSRGSANSIVTHDNHVWIYRSTQRNTDHDPEQYPQYWWKLDTPIRVLNHDSSTVTHWRSGDFFLTETGELRMATATISSSPADIISDHTGEDQEFLWLNESGSGGAAASDATPEEIGETGAAGTATPYSREDHVHVGVSRIEPGAGVSVNRNHGNVTVTATGVAVQEEGTEVTSAATAFNFTGTGATASASNGTVTVNIPGGQAGSLDDGSVTTAKLADGSVTTPKLADDAVTGAKIADATIHGGALIDGTIPTVKIGDSQVTGAKLSSNAVSTGKIADNAITSAKIAAGAVGSSDLASFAVLASKLNSNAVTTAKIAADAVTEAKIADGAVTSAKLAADAAGEGKVPIDNTLQFDGSGNLGVQITTVTENLDEDIRYYSTDTTREDAHQASKGVVFQDTSRFAKKIHSVEWDFEGDGIGNNYATFLVGIDSSDDISHLYAQSDVLFNVTTSGTHRTTFGTEGARVPGGVERLGVFLTRTGSPQDATHETKVYRGQPADDSPRESYPSASLDFPFWRSARFDSSRPEIGEHIDNYITNGEIYGYPKIRYSIEVEHAPFVGDESVSASHISSGSSADGTVLTADGSGGAAFEAGGLSESEVDARVTAGVLDFAETGNTDDVPISKIPGGVTHIESGATYNNNVISVSTAENVRGGDSILFAVPTPFGSSSTQTVSLAINGQSGSTFPLQDRNGDALHEDDLTATSVYIAISDADSWDILFLPAGSGTADGVADSLELTRSGTTITGRIGRSGTLNDLTDTVNLPADQYVDTVLHSITGSTLTTTIGRTGTLSDISDDDVLPVVTGGSVSGTTLTLTKAVGDDVTITGLPSGGGGGGVSIGDSIGTYRLVNSYTTSRMYASTVPTPAADDGDLMVITYAPDATSPDNAIGGSEVAFVPLGNLLAIPNAYTGSSAADSEGSDRDSLRTGFGQNDWLYLGGTVAGAGNITIGSTDGKYAGVFTFRILTYGTAGGGGLPGGEESDNSIASIGGAFDATTIDVPSGTWGFVNFADIGEFYSGEWHRFLVADLTGQTAGIDNGAVSDTNSLMFVANEEEYFFLGHTSAGKVLVGASATSVSPSNVRIRSN